MQQHIQRIVVYPKTLEIVIRKAETDADSDEPIRLTVPFTPNLPRQKGIMHAPVSQGTIDSETRDMLLRAIERARGWMDAILTGKVSSFNEIAATETLAERHVRRLSVLAFLSPKIVRSIADGTAPASLTISRLTQALPHEWSEQEAMLGLG
jgi:hypothetical protein